MTTKDGGLIRSCAPRPGEKKWSRSVATRCTQGSPEKRAYVIKTGWAETDKGQPGTPNVRARWVAKEYTRPELYASTPPLEALKILLSEIALGNRAGKVVALLMCGQRMFFYAPARRRCLSNCRPKITSQLMNTCSACCNTACAARDAAQN